MTNNITFISAGAGSGKTYSLTERLESMLVEGEVTPSGVMATTFTKLAASELKERVRSQLIASGQLEVANQMEQASIGTVNSVCGDLLKRFAFEAGMPPDQKVVDDDDNALLLFQAMESTLEGRDSGVVEMNRLAYRLGSASRGRRGKSVERVQWRSEVRSIIKQARSNNQSTEQIRTRGKNSADSLLAHFRKPSQRKLNDLLIAAIDSALLGIDTEVDTTGVTQKYLDFLSEIRAALKLDRMTWEQWFKLTSKAPGKKSREFAEPIQSLGEDAETHPNLQKDIRFFTETLFEIAADTMDAYAALKTQKGLIDFVDQEQRVYTLLDHPEVVATLSDELDVLMVDEFQDTSPIQLALFLKLSTLVKRVIWVGDIKQSIYGFRGSDPTLMTAVVEQVIKDGNPPEILEQSWRSRPALVEYANALFVPAFSNTLTADQVSLVPAREELSTQSAVELWSLVAGKKEDRIAAAAIGIQRLLDSDREVVDKKIGQLRPLEFGDIAVLCRTNANLNEMAGALASLKIPVRYKRTGLLSTPEGSLVYACLRRLVDPSDTLATAEIHSLSNSQLPDSWLEQRLEFLSDPEHSSRAWLEDDLEHPVAKLAQHRNRLGYLTPVEALRLAIDAGDVRKTVSAWGPTQERAQHRLNNVSAVIGHAEDYVNSAATLREPISTTGLILWLSALAEEEEDAQAKGGDSNAVRLVTHHGSKGLEWPIVIAMDLDAPLRPRIWGLRIDTEGHTMDLKNPLRNRELEYWCKFAGGTTKGPLLEKLHESERAKLAISNENEEAKRLLYVSITRARDSFMIALNSKCKPDTWMGAVSTDVLLPGDDGLILPNGFKVPSGAKVLAPEDFEAPEEPFEPRWPVEPTFDVVEKLPLRLSPSRAPVNSTAKVGTVLALGEPIVLTGEYQVDALGSALHAVIAGEIIGQSMAGDILMWHGMNSVIKTKQAIEIANRLISAINDNFSPISIAVEYPITYTNEHGQQVSGWIDCLVETDSGFIVIDHKSSAVNPGAVDAALRYSGQIAAYASGIEQATGKPVMSQWVHFCVSGCLVQIIPGPIV